MKYDFPHIRHIDDVLPAIEGSPEFIRVEKDGYQVINYVVMTGDTFPNIMLCENGHTGEIGPAFYPEDLNAMIRRECRGLIFDMDGVLINRRYHKFFNVNERDETLVGNLDWLQPHAILEKLDGSMVSPCNVNGNIRWMTKMGITDVSMEAEVFVAQHPRYNEFAAQLLEDGLTPIFEWCSNKNRIVLDYPEDRLVLTAIRGTITGKYFSHDALQEAGDYYGIEVVKVYESSDDDLIEYIRKLEDAEGVVVRFDDGHMVKIKCDWYVRIHKVKSLLESEKDVVALILNNELDDLLPVLPQEDVARVNEFSEAMNLHLKQVSHELYTQIISCRDTYKARKEFAIVAAASIEPMYRSMIFKFFDIDIDEAMIYNAVIDSVKFHCTSNSQYDKIKVSFMKGISYE